MENEAIQALSLADNETIKAIALMLGAAWAAGINLYAAVLVLGLLGNAGYAELPPALQVLQDPLVIGVAGIMYFIEFFADKTPGVDSGWDAIHTFIRIPAGAVLAAGAAQAFEVNQALELAAALVGGGVAATSHFTKAGSRLMINTSPEPVTNWAASLNRNSTTGTTSSTRPRRPSGVCRMILSLWSGVSPWAISVSR